MNSFTNPSFKHILYETPISYVPVQVEIVMGLEEAFGISVEEENAQSIATVHDAAEMIDKIIEAKV